MGEGFRLLAGRPVIKKDPDAELDYTLDYTLSIPDPDSINTYTIVSVVGVTVVRTVVSSGKYVTLWISGGAVGKPAGVTVRVATVGTGGYPRTVDQTIYFDIKPK